MGNKTMNPTSKTHYTESQEVRVSGEFVELLHDMPVSPELQAHSGSQL